MQEYRYTVYQLELKHIQHTRKNVNELTYMVVFQKRDGLNKLHSAPLNKGPKYFTHICLNNSTLYSSTLTAIINLESGGG